jgi:prophage DNA circulation protein
MSAASDAFATASTQLATALAAATTDPADAVRLLLPLCTWEPPPVFGGGPLAAAVAKQQAAIVRNLHCAAIAALTSACADYRPISYQDALSLRSIVCSAIDAVATRAADAGDDQTYSALRNLRVAVAIDLAARGANLPALIEVQTLVSMPSLAEAWELYQDTSREPELVAAADAPHPLFLPLSFPALSR